jgi:sporulation protein YlmC with PRC-barrel domain
MVRNTARHLLLATCIAAVPTITLAQTPSQTAAQAAATMSGKFLAAPQSGQIRAADLREADIYTSDNQKVGDIDDILLDSRGNVVAVVVGVGGFLGIGEKNVAIPFSALEIQTAPNSNMANSTAANRDRMTTGTNPNAITTPNSSMTDQDRQRATAQRAEEMSREQANQTMANQRMAQASTGRWKPERVLLKGVTKADLQNAPEFLWDGNVRTNANTPARIR